LRPPADPIGTHALRDGHVALGFGLAFGHADSTALEELARAAASAGGTGLRTAPGRALLVVGLDERSLPRMSSTARSGWASSCARRIRAARSSPAPGAPICAAAEISGARAGAGLAESVAIGRRDAPMVHVSGCAKGCACARPAPVTVVGSTAAAAWW
jgi:precorrin-3B synthase